MNSNNEKGAEPESNRAIKENSNATVAQTAQTVKDAPTADIHEIVMLLRQQAATLAAIHGVLVKQLDWLECIYTELQ